MVVAFDDLIVCDLITGANIKKQLINTTNPIEIIEIYSFYGKKRLETHKKSQKLET